MSERIYFAHLSVNANVCKDTKCFIEQANERLFSVCKQQPLFIRL